MSGEEEMNLADNPLLRSSSASINNVSAPVVPNDDPAALPPAHASGGAGSNNTLTRPDAAAGDSGDIRAPSGAEEPDGTAQLQRKSSASFLNTDASDVRFTAQPNSRATRRGSGNTTLSMGPWTPVNNLPSKTANPNGVPAPPGTRAAALAIPHAAIKKPVRTAGGVGGGGKHSPGAAVLPPIRKAPQVVRTAVKPKEFDIARGDVRTPKDPKNGVPAVMNEETGGVPKGIDPPSRRPFVVRRNRKEKYAEVPHVLDGFFLLNKAPAEDPDDVYVLDGANHQLRYVIEDDLSLFTKLHTLRVGENNLPMARLGALPALKSLHLPLNGIKDLDLDLEGKFPWLEYLDLSYNSLSEAAIIVLAATLPRLKTLEITDNKIRALPKTLIDMSHWRDRVIELLLPAQVALMDAIVKEEGVTAAEAAAAAAAVVGGDVNGGQDLAGGKNVGQNEDDEGSQVIAVQLTAFGRAEVAPVHVEKEVRAEDAVSSISGSQPTENSLPFASEEPAKLQASMVQKVSSHPVPNPQPIPKEKPVRSTTPTAPLRHQPQFHDATSVTTGTRERLGFLKAKDDESRAVHLLRGRSLRVLNLSGNRFRSFEVLAPPSARSPPTTPGTVPASPGAPPLEEKFDGFYRLEDLDVSRNQVDTPGGLMGIVWLPALRRVKIDGNPIVKKRGGVIGIKGREEAPGVEDVLGYLEFDPVEILPKVYGIEVADLEFHEKVPILQDTYYALAQTENGPALRRVQKPKPKFIGTILKKAPGGLQPLHPLALSDPNAAAGSGSQPQLLPHQVEDTLQTLGASRRRTLRAARGGGGGGRRSDWLTDEDVRATIRAGRILTLKELTEARLEAEREEEQERLKRERLQAIEEALQRQRALEAEAVARKLERQAEEARKKEEEEAAAAAAAAAGTEGGTTQNSDGRQASVNGNQVPTFAVNNPQRSPTQDQKAEESAQNAAGSKGSLHYDPKAVDKTFLTGVHITGGGGDDNETVDDEDLSFLDDSSIAASDDPSDDRSDQDDTTDNQSGQHEDEDLSFDSDSSSSDATLRDRGINRFHVYPRTIQASIRALRHALWNPVSYWRVLEESYAKPTFASSNRFRKDPPAVGPAAAPNAPGTAETAGSYHPSQGPQHSTGEGHTGSTSNATTPFMNRRNPYGITPAPTREGGKHPGGGDLDSEGGEDGDGDGRGKPRPDPSGFVSPANTMWTTYAAQAAIEREAEVAKEEARQKKLAKKKGNYPVQHAKNDDASGSHQRGGFGDLGVFGDDEAREVASKLSAEVVKETLRKAGRGGRGDSDSETSSVSGGGDASSDSAVVAAQEELGRKVAMVQKGRVRMAETAPTPSTAMALGDEDAKRRAKAAMTPAEASALAERRVEQYRTKIGGKIKGRGGRNYRRRDDFEELMKLMTEVDQRIVMIEANLGNEVQDEYSRVEKRYSDAAEKRIRFLKDPAVAIAEAKAAEAGGALQKKTSSIALDAGAFDGIGDGASDGAGGSEGGGGWADAIGELGK
ncbi:X-ray radiation resistance-associated protein 1 [Phlyctochytrium bullatum]|nr:X-ray radiation resistance-associated protein 1 [Phlyctochytrium bullatum]